MRLEQQRKDEAKREAIRVAREERNKLKAAGVKVRAEERKAAEEEFRQMLVCTLSLSPSLNLCYDWGINLADLIQEGRWDCRNRFPVAELWLMGYWKSQNISVFSPKFNILFSWLVGHRSSWRKATFFHFFWLGAGGCGGVTLGQDDLLTLRRPGARVCKTRRLHRL